MAEAEFKLPSRPGSPPNFERASSQEIHSDEPLEEPSMRSPGKPTPPRHDDTFYFESVTFQVGNTLFRVSKTGFMVPGTIFEVMFALPSEDTGNPEGSSDSNPIHLSVDESSFKSFLRVLYPSLVKDDTIDPDENYRHLVAALGLATMWEFHRLRKEIISSLTPIVNTRSNLEAIFLAKKYDVADWLRTSYKKLVNPVVDLSIDELTCLPFPLDWPTIAKIFFVRETLTKSGITNTNVSCPKCNVTYGVSYGGTLQRYTCDCRVVTLIDTQFQAELSSMGEQFPDIFNVNPPTTLGGKGKKKKKALR